MAVHLLEGPRIRPRRQGGVLATLRHLDLLLLSAASLLGVVGIVAVYSATRSAYPFEPTYYAKRQVLYTLMGFCVMVVCMAFDYRRLREWGYALYGLTVLALLAVLAIGRSQYGAQRWIAFGPIHLQPSEFGVLGIIIAVALYVERHSAHLGPKRLATLAGLVVVPIVLTYKQPDRSTALVMVVVFFSLLVFAGVRLRYLIGAVALAGIVVLIAVKGGLVPLGRFTSFLHQGSNTGSSNYEIDIVKQAIGAGGLRGTGLFHGQVTNLQYVPDQYADFIFSAIGEQLGFVGCAAVLGLFGVVALRMFRAAQTHRDTLGRMICAGSLAFLAFSVFQNVGMNLGLVPIAGIPLPFISFGGSALLSLYAAVGLVANVELRKHLVR